MSAAEAEDRAAAADDDANDDSNNDDDAAADAAEAPSPPPPKKEEEGACSGARGEDSRDRAGVSCETSEHSNDPTLLLERLRASGSRQSMDWEASWNNSFCRLILSSFCF